MLALIRKYRDNRSKGEDNLSYCHTNTEISFCHLRGGATVSSPREQLNHHFVVIRPLIVQSVVFEYI